MGKVDDLKAYREWNEYHSSLKRDMAVDSLSDAERRRKLARLEKDPVCLLYTSDAADEVLMV